MPGGNGTGPRGLGPMTGRAAGYCAGYPVPGFANPAFGRGFGFGFGRGGRGRRNRFYATGVPGWGQSAVGFYGWGGPNYGVPYGVPQQAPTREQELDMLKGQAEYLEDMLENINKRISELDSEKK